MRPWRVFLVVLLTQSSIVASEHPLQLAWQLSDESYSGWTYGGVANEKRINCVQFLEDVLERLLRRSLRAWERDKLLIQNISKKENLQKLVERGEKRTRGIQHALVSMRRGSVVSPKNARPGDFVQYWYKKDSLWVGHAAIIQEVVSEANFYCSYTFGAHESLNGVGVAGYMVTLNDPHMKVYIVRFH
jgi:hypothetical protein